MSFDVVRREDFPEYLYQRLQNWGACSRSNGGGGRGGTVESRFRSNRCPDCYESDDPCEVCRVYRSNCRVLDVEDAELIEAAWVMLGVGSVERRMLRDHFIWSSPPRAVIRKYGIRRDQFWYLLLRGSRELEQHARMIACRRGKSVAVSSRQQSDLPGWQAKQVA